MRVGAQVTALAVRMVGGGDRLIYTDGLEEAKKGEGEVGGVGGGCLRPELVI